MAASNKVTEIKKNESVERSNSFPQRGKMETLSCGSSSGKEGEWGSWAMMEQGDIGKKRKEDKEQVCGRQDKRKTDH